MQQQAAVVARGEAALLEVRDAAGRILMTPIAPDQALAHVERPPVREKPARSQAERRALDDGPQMAPIRQFRQRRDRSGAGVEQAGDERRRRGHRPALGERAPAAEMAIADREDRLDLVFARQSEAVLDDQPVGIFRRRHRRPGGQARRGGSPLRRCDLERPQVGDRDISAASDELARLTHPIDAHDQAVAGGADRLDADQGVLETDGARNRRAELLGGSQEGVRRRLALQPKARRLFTVDDDVDERGQAACLQHRLGVAAGGYQGRLQACSAQVHQQGSGVGEDLKAVLGEALQEVGVLARAEGSDGEGVRRIASLTLGEL